MSTKKNNTEKNQCGCGWDHMYAQVYQHWRKVCMENDELRKRLINLYSEILELQKINIETQRSTF